MFYVYSMFCSNVLYKFFYSHYLFSFYIWYAYLHMYLFVSTTCILFAKFLCAVATMSY